MASPVPSEDRNGSSSTVTPLSLQPQAHLREERPSGSRPLPVQSWAGLEDEPSSRARPLSLTSSGAHRAKRGSRTGSSDTTLSRGAENDYSAHLHQGDFELEQDAGHFHFDKDTDAEREKSKAEEKEQPREAADGRKSYVEARKSQGAHAGENADLEKANGILPLSRQPTRKSTGSQRRKDPNMVSRSQANRSWFVRPCLAILRPKS